jgi:threonine dehydratase
MTRPTRSEIEAAAARIAPHVRRTPVMRMAGGDLGLDFPLILKLELLQATGSFKPRGAFNRMLSAKLPEAGVATASGGNHGAAVAYAAMKRGVPATIFVPSVASPAKMEQIRGYGARLEVAGERYDDALRASERWIAQTGAAAIHAYDQWETMQGQGTVALELEEQAPDLDALLVAVGGGGLIGGIAAWYAGRMPVIGVEPELAPTLAHALAVAEPGGAAAMAALLSGRWKARAGQRVGVLLCGANTTAVSF